MKAFDYFKNNSQKYMKECFLICKSTYILKFYSIHYTLRLNKNVKEEVQGLQALQAFAFPVVTVNDEHAKSRLKRKFGG